MSGIVLIIVRFHDGRYHGLPDVPPSPARLFQALVAGVGLSGPLKKEDRDALGWLESLDPPVIASPTMWRQQPFNMSVPNNDLDSKGGDERRIGKIRTWKSISPQAFDAAIPLLYAWSFQEGIIASNARHICKMADSLYQFGRGTDMAWATGEIINNEDLGNRLGAYPGLVYHPTSGSKGLVLPCPAQGSLASLEHRYASSLQRFTNIGQGKTTKQLFTQQPKPRFRHVPYDSPPTRHMYDLRHSSEDSFNAWPIQQASKLVTWIRDGAAARLQKSLPGQVSDIERFLIGRKADGTDDVPSSLRVRIIPLPSIGRYHADCLIRRILVEVPAGCPLRADDVNWAFSGLEVVDTSTGEILDSILTASIGQTMLEHFGISGTAGFYLWRTLTPVAVPEGFIRRQNTAFGATEKRRKGAERQAAQGEVAKTIVQALRHAGFRERPEIVRVQREPFEANGKRADSFSPGTRFSRSRLWHTELAFGSPIAGPVVIGDGRFLGLGVMAPKRQLRGIYAFAIEKGLNQAPKTAELTQALRRAVLARVGKTLGTDSNLPAFFSGHEDNGSPARTEKHPHLAFAFDAERQRLIIIAPSMFQNEPIRSAQTHDLLTLETALAGFRELRAGLAGCLTLRQISIDLDWDPLFKPSSRWSSLTPYVVARHSKCGDPHAALADDLKTECRRRNLPEPSIKVVEAFGLPRVGLSGNLVLTFKVAVTGPVILGKTRHLGGGLFGGESRQSRA